MHLNGCSLSSGNSNKDIFQYKGTYIGNNSAIGDQLPQSDAFKQMALQTEKKPYGMILEYGNVTGVIKNLVINNATYIKRR